jgi:hypothetical protein
MKSLKTLATGVGATMLATSMLTGFTAAAPKPVINPKMHVVAPKPVMIKPIRPTITRPHVRVRVNRDLLEKKADRDDGQAEALPRSVSQPHRKKGVAAMLPLQRLPKPRPEFEDALKDIRDVINADGVSGADPDEIQVATIPHGSNGPLGDFGLPGQDGDTGKAPGGGQTSGPLGGMPGNDNMWNDPYGAIGSDIPNPAGENSHGKDTPETAPGVRVTPGSIAAAIGGVASGSDNGDDHSFVDENGSATGRPGGRFQFNASTGEDGEYQSEIYTNEDRQTGVKTTVIFDRDGRTIEVIHPNGDRSASRTEGGEIVENDYETAPRHVETAPVVFDNAGPKDTGVNKLENPDHVAGGYVPVNCGSVGCNESRKGKPGLRLSDGMVRALTDPEHSAAGSRTSAEPIVTQYDLLSQYDPEFNGGGGPTPIDKPRIQSD